MQASLDYNSRLQLQSLAYTKGASTLCNLNYSYTADPASCSGVQAGNNGQIQRITDNVDATRTTTYTYDAWARLKQASNTQWTVAETYDRYGNRKSQSAPVANSVTVNASTNRLTDPGYSYDAAGNMTADGLNTMTYNGENRVVTSATGGVTSAYSYDGNGLRVKKQVGADTPTVYIFSGTKVIAEYASGAAAASPQREYIYSGSQLLAKIEGSSTNYYHADHLSLRTITDSSGAVTEQKGHFPFGENWYGGANSDKWKFTSYERDSESGNDYAMFRTSINRLGRFSSPDPLAGSISDPQSLNRYAYARNDPIENVDPSGRDWFSYWMDASHHLAPLLDFGSWIEDYQVRAFFGASYYSLPGRGNPVKEAEDKYAHMVLISILKYRLKWIFEHNKECADLLGGAPRALDLLSKMRFVDLSVAGWRFPKNLTTYDLAAANEVYRGDLTAAVAFGTKRDRGGEVWNGQVFNTYVAGPFFGFKLPALETIAIHEMLHVARNEERDERLPSDADIVRICETGDPSAPQ